MTRFQVTELEGFGNVRGSWYGTASGLSCTVIDTAWNYRVMATYRSDSYIRGPGGMVANAKAKARRLAAEHAARLNTAVQS